MRLYSQYLNDNEDFDAFLNKVSDNTGERSLSDWKKNLRENSRIFRSDRWATEKLHDAERGKTAIMIGSSPALKKQLDTLREIQHDPDFVLCGLSSNLDFLLRNDIRPRYCIVVDADESTGRDWDRIDMGKTQNVTLVSGLYTYPSMLLNWQGPLYWLAFVTMDKKLKRLQHRFYGDINGTGEGFPPLMSQYNIMTAFSFSVLGCHVILFVGNELSYANDGSSFYVDRQDPRDSDRRLPHMDIYGNMVKTNFGLMALKLALEAFLGTICGAGWFINCTEAGIFGITKRFKDYHVPWVQQLTLKTGIAQARSIMRTGHPYYDVPIVRACA